ncbi:MAG: hypothetical protein F4Y20_04325 [Acidobacteria bacterium]|nr:hypothetical protein [Acidobacteriota bacterium]MYB31759.1 hypothetical protein [Acidobacteriota bacterium]MYG74022.1 hypothetical protein [Acidobacteriota bacterium]MYH22596.1 hypothetical protein [Acidobacteriota bacterium]MYK80628.1 hypothetical protein [Acidobacteriota bacterium]
MVIPQYQEFVRANSSSRHALLTFILGYHMYEWANGKRFDKEDFVSRYPNDTDLVEAFAVARGIANGTKHFKARAKTKVQTGFSSGFSDDFARPLNVTLADGTEQSADNLLRRIVEFWQRQERSGAF